MSQIDPKSLSKQLDIYDSQVLIKNSMFERKTNPVQFEHEVRFFILPSANVATLPNGVTTPTVSNIQVAYSPTAPVTVTEFSKGSEGQILTILGNGNLTVANSARIVTNTGGNKLLENNRVYKFVYLKDVWYEIGPAEDGVIGGGPISTVSITQSQYFISQSIAGIVAGNSIELEVWGTILINAGLGPYTLTLDLELGSFVTSLQDPVTFTSDSANSYPVHIKAAFAVQSTSNAAVVARLVRGSAIALNTGVAVQSQFMGRNTSSSNLTGTQLLRARFRTSLFEFTQDFTLVAFNIRKV